jgi:hypothetical protein
VLARAIRERERIQAEGQQECRRRRREAGHLLGGVDAPSRAAAIRRLSSHPEEALDLLDLPQLQ